ncbi:MAG: hypothetical protein IJP55_07315, partial [Bacteroidales bacterium]|nr:hypothetical protein [Bacteroidales bacterium]
TYHAVGGIVGWPQSEDKTAVYVAKNCTNSGDITFEGRAKVRIGGVHGGTGRMDGCKNTGKITFVSGQSGSVAASVAAFHSQAHTFSNCVAEGTVEAKAPLNALGGLVANLGNVAFTGMDGCSVNCTLIGGPVGNTGLIVGKFNGTSNAITLGSADDPIEVAGSANGNTISADNVVTYFSGATGFSADMHTVYYSFGGNVYKNDPFNPSFKEDLANLKFTYDGKEYPIVKLADDRYWMAAPMAYVPFGKTVSSDPKEDAGIWYTYSVVDGTAVPNTSNTDAYLYDAATAFGLSSFEDITYGTQAEWETGNYRSFEGTQGICPDGWYIPTRADFLKLVGGSNKDDTQGETAAVDDNTALYYETGYSGSSVPRFNSEGWNFSFLASRNKTSKAQTGAYGASALIDNTKSDVPEWYGKPGLNQIWTSTPYKPNVAGNSVQYFCLMSTFTKTYFNGRLSLSYGQYLSGMEVRCIRKAE